ncbi:MAG: hypothetical protein ACE3JQ_11345 [Paenisporosarcina sp.]
MKPIYVVIIFVFLAFSWKLFTILRNPELSASIKRVAFSIFFFSMISLVVAILYTD